MARFEAIFNGYLWACMCDNLMSPIRCLLGGTFDPVHLGHMHMAQATYAALKTPIYFLPCAQPIHKPHSMIDQQHRLNMLKLAIEMHPDWHIDDSELQAGRPFSTYDSLQQFQLQHHQTLCFVMGSDSLATLPSWHDWKQLSALTHFLVINRHKHPIEVSDAIWHHFTYTEDIAQFKTHKSGLIHILKVPAYPISSTQIRQRISQDNDMGQFLTAPIAKYIDQHKLYQ